MLECKNSQIQIGAACIQLSSIFLHKEVSFSLLARFYIRSGVLFAVNCNLPSKGKEFALGPFTKALLDRYSSLLNQTVFGMCFTDTLTDAHSL